MEMHQHLGRHAIIQSAISVTLFTGVFNIAALCWIFCHLLNSNCFLSVTADQALFLIAHFLPYEHPSGLSLKSMITLPEKVPHWIVIKQSISLVECKANWFSIPSWSEITPFFLLFPLFLDLLKLIFSLVAGLNKDFSNRQSNKSTLWMLHSIKASISRLFSISSTKPPSFQLKKQRLHLSFGRNKTECSQGR